MDSDLPKSTPASNQTPGAMPKTENLANCGVTLKTTDGLIDMTEV